MVKSSVIPQDLALVHTSDFSLVRQYLLNLLCTTCYREGDFVLSSGQVSPYYVNAKPAILHPIGALATGRLLFSMLPPQTEAIAGLTLGADPMVTSVSIASVYKGQPIPALIIRKEAKGHGTMAYIEGPLLKKNTEIVVLEDVVTTGSSALKAVKRLQDADYIVNEIIALVDRQQGGAQLYQQEGLNFQAVFTLAEIQKQYKIIKSSP